MSQLASFFIRMVGRASARRFEKATADPIAAQHSKLMRIVRRNQDTEYGREHGFASIKTFAEYQSAVPIIIYE